MEGNQNEYKYLIKNKTNHYLSLEDVIHNSYNADCLLNVICYHITSDSKYPFIQFLLEKIPYCNGLVDEEFILPVVSLYNQNDTIETIVLNKVQQYLKKIGLHDDINLDTNAYNGIFTDIFDEQYALVDISNINITYLPQMRRNSPLWFALPSEIINSGKICNINIDDRLRELFIHMPELGILHKSNSNETIPLPYAAYTGSTLKKSSFHSVFGSPKRKLYDSCGEYFFFHKNFGKAVKEGGWIEGINIIDMNNKDLTHSKSDALIVDNEYGRYIDGGINRYAIFSTYDSTIHIEDADVPTITDEIINESDSTIFISFKSGSTNSLPNVIVTEYDSFIPLSYHKLDKKILDIKYDTDKINMYMIS